LEYRHFELAIQVLDVGDHGVRRSSISWFTGRYVPDAAPASENQDDQLVEKVRAGDLTAAELLARYSAMLHRRLGTYAEVAKRIGLDPRTTRKHVDDARSG
jgi:hypothetical protein